MANSNQRPLFKACLTHTDRQQCPPAALACEQAFYCFEPSSTYFFFSITTVFWQGLSHTRRTIRGSLGSTQKRLDQLGGHLTGLRSELGQKSEHLCSFILGLHNGSRLRRRHGISKSGPVAGFTSHWPKTGIRSILMDI